MSRFFFLFFFSSVFTLPCCSGELTTPAALASVDTGSNPGEPFVYRVWESWYAQEGGLPNDHIFALRADGDRLWVGTEKGLALYEHGTWQSWTEKQGLPFDVVSSIAVDPKTQDVWIGLFGGGLTRFSAGRFDHWNQFNSGLVNDVVYGVTVAGDEVWVATTAGISCYNSVSGQWEIYTEKNSPMHEIWAYGIDSADGKVFAAVWGGGILEFDLLSRRWNAHLDPDGEMEIDLYRDDGLIHVITTSASYVEKTLWASTYFGLSRYDGRSWRGYTLLDSGLISEFINFSKGRSADSSYNCTDMGLAVLVDFRSDTWVTYKRDHENSSYWNAHVFNKNQELKVIPTNLNLPNHFVMTCEFQGDDLWIGTGHGLARASGEGFFKGLKNQEGDKK